MSVEIRRGNAEEYDDFIDFVNYVFGFNGASSSFVTLLPNYYQRKDSPQAHNLILFEDGKMKAAVGMEDYRLRVCDEDLHCCGIGNVAVHPYSRGKGYMKKLMWQCVDEMKRNGVDFSVLGGRRHRYLHFSYDKVGTAFCLNISSAAMDQCFGTDRKSKYAVKRVRREDDVLLDAVFADRQRQPFAPQRERERIYDILTSHFWNLYAVTENGEYRGYAVTDKDHVKEYVIPAGEDDAFLIALFDGLGYGSLQFRLGLHEKEHIKALVPRFEGYSMDAARMISVFCYENVIRAFLKLKLTYDNLPDGRFSMLIHGQAGDEALCVTVENGACKVEKCDAAVCDVELTHEDAMRFLFAPIYPVRDERAPMYARLWFPLPIWVSPVENF